MLLGFRNLKIQGIFAKLALSARHRKKIFFGIGFLFLVNTFDLAVPLLIQNRIDAMAGPAPRAPAFYLWGAGGALLLFLGQALGRWGWRRFVIVTSMESSAELRNRIYARMVSDPPAFFERWSTGDKMQRVTQDVDAVRMAVGSGVIVVFDAAFYFLLVPIVLFYLHWKLAWICLFPIPFAVAWLVLFNLKLQVQLEKIQDFLSSMAAFVHESWTGIRMVKGLRMESVRQELYRSLSSTYDQKQKKWTWLQSLVAPSLEGWMALSWVALLVWGGPSMGLGEITIGTWIAFQRWLQKLIWPMSAVSVAALTFLKAKVSLKRLEPWQGVVKDASGTTSVQPSVGPIEPLAAKDASAPVLEWRSVSFRYGATQTQVLENFSLAVEKNQKIWIRGPIGTGKSTLLQLGIGLLTPTSGDLLWQGEVVEPAHLPELRKKIALVAQDGFILRGTVRENLWLGFPEAMPRFPVDLTLGQARLESALQLAQFQSEMEDQRWIDAPIGEGGVGLSGGQRQRLSLARAWVRGAQVLLLDDCFSAVDERTEAAILKELLEQRDLTLVLVSHRDYTKWSFDHTVELSPIKATVAREDSCVEDL